MRPLHTLAWACYLGSSWTWVIGMLLPILLVRDYGPWGWVAFAVPNVLGAMAMGFVLNRQRSVVLVASYPAACLAFSRVTMAYQVIVLPWALVELFAWPVWDALGAAVVVYAIVMTFAWRAPLSAAVGVTLLSLVAFACFTWWEGPWLTVFNDDLFTPRLGRDDFGAFTLAAAFGFALCPYLDLTFHEARQKSNPAAFVIGFGVVFLTMIVFSLSYALPLVDGVFPFTGDATRRVLGLHVLMQSALTVALHLRHVCRFEQTRPLRTALPLVLFLLLGAFMVVWHAAPTETFGMTVSQVMYRVLLILYGTMFPMYVLVAMTPIGRRSTRRRRMRIALFAGAMCVPMAFITFVEGRAVFIVGIAVTIVIAAALPAFRERTA